MQRKAKYSLHHHVSRLLAAGLLLSLSGCAMLRGMRSSSDQLLLDGSLALSRPVPRASNGSAKTLVSSEPPATALASSDGPTALIISRSARTLTALRPGGQPLVMKTEGAQLLPQGSFSVTMKEENPLWYAPREYFANRDLPIPSEGSRERFRRAALGSRTIYLNDQTPIHSGPVWLKEIGGVRVSDAQMSELYSMIAVGTRVEVR